MKGQNLNQMSYNELQHYLTQPRKQKLTKNILNKINKNLKKEQAANKNTLQKLSRCNVMKLAAKQLKRQGKADCKTVGQIIRYSVDMSQAILTSFKIIKQAEKKKINLSYINPKLLNKNPIITNENKTIALLINTIIKQTINNE